MLGVGLIPKYETTETVDLAVQAEDVGFDTVFTSYQYGTADPFLVLSEIADATDEVRVGPDVINPYQVHPVVLTSRMATLETISDGRSIRGSRKSPKRRSTPEPISSTTLRD